MLNTLKRCVLSYGIYSLYALGWLLYIWLYRDSRSQSLVSMWSRYGMCFEFKIQVRSMVFNFISQHSMIKYFISHSWDAHFETCSISYTFFNPTYSFSTQVWLDVPNENNYLDMWWFFLDLIISTPKLQLG